MREKFKSSLESLQSVRTLTQTAILIALAIVVEYITRPFAGEYLKITFTFLPFMAICMLFGPVVGMLAGGIIDFIGAVIFYGSVNPLLCVVELISGLVCGFLLYRKKPNIWTCLFVRLVVCMVFNTVFATASLAIWNGMSINGLFTLLSSRALKNLICFPIEGILLFAVLKIVNKVVKG